MTPVTVAGWGDNQFGQIGNGHLVTGGAVFPPKHYELDNIKSVDAGLHHSIALSRDGNVLTWGDNAYGQAGAGKIGGIRPSPKAVQGLRDIIQVAAGQDHSVALDASGRVWTWGLNMSGQLGDGTNANSSNPRIILGLSDVRYVAAGYRSSLAVKKDGTVWAWGGFCNLKTRTKNLQDYITSLSVGGYGHGNGGTIDDVTPEEDCLYEDYLNVKSYQPVQIKGLPAVEKIDIGWGHALAITKEGELWAWGCNMYGQVGVGKGPASPAIHTPTRIKGIGRVTEAVTGYRHSLALTEDGKLWGWGHNYYGEIGAGEQEQIVTSPRLISFSEEINHIYAGHDYSLFLTKNGEIWGLGHASFGQLGGQQASFERHIVKVAPGQFTTVAAGGGHGLAILK